MGQDASFAHGRRQLQLLANLEVSTKSVDRVAEAIGADIARSEQEEVGRAMQFDLPIVIGKPIPVLYIEMDGTGVPTVKKGNCGPSGETRWRTRPHQGS